MRAKKKKDFFFLAVRHKESVCESKEKQKRFFFNRKTYIRDIVIDLIIMKLIRNLSRGFSFKGKIVFHVNILFSYVWLLFKFGNISDNII